VPEPGSSAGGWRATRGIVARVAAPFGRHRGVVMSVCGPAILVLLVFVWALVLAFGAGLVIHPELGTAVRADSGDTDTSFATALFVGASSLSVVGASDFTPHTNALRVLFLGNSLIGVSVLSLTLTYLMQVYSALHRRNALGLNLNLASAGSGDAAELLARFGPQGRFEGSQSSVAALAVEMGDAKETHHFYPVLFYFRFAEPEYAVSRMALVALDAAALVQSAFHDEAFPWLKESAAITHLGGAAGALVRLLQARFCATGERGGPPDPAAAERWRRRYFRALHRLRRAGIRVVDDHDAGAEMYVRLRNRWDADVRDIAAKLEFDMAEIDPAACADGAAVPMSAVPSADDATPSGSSLPGAAAPVSVRRD
jgi:hypothetical protein